MKKYFLRLSLGALVFALLSLNLFSQDAFNTQVRSGIFSASYGSGLYDQVSVQALSGQVGSTKFKGSAVEAFCKKQSYGSVKTPLALFGDKSSKSPMVAGKVYRFAVRSGVPVFAEGSQWVEQVEGSDDTIMRPISEPQVRIVAYSLSAQNESPSVLEISIPKEGSPEWDAFLANGASSTFEDSELITTIRVIPDEKQPWIELSHVAKRSGYTYIVEFISGAPLGEDRLKQVPLAHKRERRGSTVRMKAAYAPVYTLHFDSIPSWQFTSVEPGFDKEACFDGESSVFKVNPALVQGLDHEAALKLDASPELRRAPELWSLVGNFRGDALSSVGFVFNKIELADMLTYEDVSPRAYAETGTSALARSALGVLLEKQGSPLELCALTVYLLRSSGVPAWYAFPKEEGVGIRTNRLNALLGLNQGDLVSSNDASMVRVSYPWVVAYVDGEWLNIFPWMRDMDSTSFVQPDEVVHQSKTRGSLWVKDYLLNSSGVKEASIFEAYIEGLNQEQGESWVGSPLVGSGALNLKKHHYYYAWDHLPQPDVLPENYEIVDSLDQRGDCFERIRVEVVLPSKQGSPRRVLLDTGDIPVAELIERGFTASWEQLSGDRVFALTLDRLEEGVRRANVDVPFHALSVSVQRQSLRWNTSALVGVDAVELLIHYKRPSLEDSTDLCEWVESRVVNQGEFASLCLNLGRVTQPMVERKREAFNNLVRNMYSLGVKDEYALFAVPSSLMGAEYFEQMTLFGDTFLPLHLGNKISLRSIALAKFKEEKTEGEVVVTPMLDVFHLKMGVLNVCSKPAHLESVWDARQDYFALYSLEASLREAWAVGHLFNFDTPVSAVSLIRHANDLEEEGVIRLTQANFKNEGERVIKDKPLKAHNPVLWKKIVSYFDDSAVHPEFVEAYITPGALTLGDFSGMAAFVTTPYGADALLDEMHGGYGGAMNIESMVGFLGVEQDKNREPVSSLPEKIVALEDPVRARTTALDSYVNDWAPSNIKPIMSVPGGGGIIPLAFNHVNLITGAFQWEEDDLALQGTFPFVVKRLYDSSNGGEGTLGYGWSIWFLEPVFIGKDEASLTLPEGRRIFLKKIKDGLYQEGSGGSLTLVGNDNKWVLVRPTGDRIVYEYAGAGAVRLASIADAMGNAYFFSYSESDLPYLERVWGNNGLELSFSYDAARRPLRLMSKDGRTVDYDYNRKGDLVSVTNSTGAQVQYFYGQRLDDYDGTTRWVSTHKLERMVDPEGVFLENTYDFWGRVVSQSSSVSKAAGEKEQYSYTYERGEHSSSGVTSVFALGKLKERFYFDSGYMLKQEDSVGGNIEQRWEYETLPGGQEVVLLKACRDKRGLVRTYRYDTSGNCVGLTLRGSITGEDGEQEAAYSYEYDSLGRVIEIKDPIGGSKITHYGSGLLSYLPLSIEELQGKNRTFQIQFKYEIIGEESDNPRIFLKEERVAGGLTPDKVTLWKYDSLGNILSVSQETGTADAAVVSHFEYTPRGEVARVIDSMGDFSEFEYDMMGHLIEKSQFNSSGMRLAREVWSHDRSGRIISHEGPEESPIAVKRYYYGVNGLLERIVQSRVDVSPEGDVTASGVSALTQFSYDGLGRRISTTLSNGAIEHFVYDNVGLLASSSVSSVEGTLLSKEFFKYNNAGDLAEHTTDLGGKESWIYSQEGRVVEYTGVDGAHTYNRYDLAGRPVEVGVPGGLVSYYSYGFKEGQLRVTERSEADGVSLSKERMFDLRGNLVSWTDFSSNVFSADYDGLDRVVALVGPEVHDSLSERRIDYFSYDPHEGSVSRRSGGLVFVEAYDSLGRIKKIENFSQEGALVSSISWLYEQGGRKVTKVRGEGVEGLAQVQFYNNAGQVLLSRWGDDRSELFAYDTAGNLVFEKSVFGQEKRFSYDGLNRLVQRDSSDAPQVSIHYDRSGHLVQTAFEGGFTHKAVRDVNGRIVFESLSSGEESISQSVYHYFDHGPHAGMLRHARHQDGTQSEYFYDSWNRPVSVKALLADRSEVVDYTYDSRGYLLSVVTNEGRGESTRVEREYDAYGQLAVEHVIVGGVLFDSWVQSWDAQGRRTQLISGDSVLGYAYDSSGRLSRMRDPRGNEYDYRYDASGRLVESRNPWRVLALGYQGQSSRPGSWVITAPAGAEAIFAEKLHYKEGRVSEVNSLHLGQPAKSTYFSYDSNSGRLLGEYSIGEKKNRSIDYGYDNSLGACVQRSQPGGWNFQGGLDAWGRIKSLSYEIGRRRFTAWGAAPGADSVHIFLNGEGVTPVRFDSSSLESIWFSELDLPMGEHTMRVDAVDAQGDVNSTESTFTVQGQSNEVILDYDKRGNVIRKRFTDNTSHSFEWDAWGRLSSITGAGPQGGFLWKAIYDGLGRQLRSIYTPASGGDSVIVDSSYDPEVEFLEIKTTHQGRSHWFIYGPDLTQRFGGLQGQGGLEAVISPEGEAQGLLLDAWGNALGTVSDAGVDWHSVLLSGYGPEPTQIPSIFPWDKNWAKIFAWRGHRLETSGYYRMGVRPYDASLASFLAPDPHGQHSSASLYAYANGDPINAYDPEGRSAYLLDGTWAHEDGMKNDPALTNAQRLHLNYVGPGESHYFRGVGNSKDNSWFAQYWAGTTGSGAREIVEDAYNEIVSNYNSGDTHILIAGWSRGAAECMELAWNLYLRGIPNLKRGGYLVPPEQACPVIDQIHLMDMVHSMGVPGNDINRGWHDLDMPPNIYRTYHYLAGEPPAFGFRQTRPPSANERAYCGVHGDVGGSVDTDCRRWVYKAIVEHANGHGLSLFDKESIEDYVEGDPSQL